MVKILLCILKNSKLEQLSDTIIAENVAVSSQGKGDGIVVAVMFCGIGDERAAVEIVTVQKFCSITYIICSVLEFSVYIYRQLLPACLQMAPQKCKMVGITKTACMLIVTISTYRHCLPLESIDRHCPSVEVPVCLQTSTTYKQGVTYIFGLHRNTCNLLHEAGPQDNT